MQTLEGISILIVILGHMLLTVESANLLDALETAAGSLFTEQEEVPSTLINKTKSHELRKYESINWVCGSELPLQESAQHETQTFLDLLGYIKQENSQGVDISMSKPVTIWYKGKSGKSQATLKACFYINSAFQKNPPTPTNSKLTIFKSAPMTVYTRQVGGHFRKSIQWLREAKNLLDVLNRDGIKVNRASMIWSAYDPPYTLFNRRNEVWFTAA